MAKQLARHGTCTVLKRNTLLVLMPLSFAGVQDASASSPVLRKCEFSITELLVPLQKFTPSANRLRKRLPVITSPSVTFRLPSPTHQPTLVCSIQMLSSQEPLPAPPLKPFSG